MALSTDERALLQLIADSPKAVAMSDYFPVLNPIEAVVGQIYLGRQAQRERQLALFGVAVELWQQGLVRVVMPADGNHSDLVEVTDDGRQALAGTRADV